MKITFEKKLVAGIVALAVLFVVLALNSCTAIKKGVQTAHVVLNAIDSVQSIVHGHPAVKPVEDSSNLAYLFSNNDTVPYTCISYNSVKRIADSMRHTVALHQVINRLPRLVTSIPATDDTVMPVEQHDTLPRIVESAAGFVPPPISWKVLGLGAVALSALGWVCVEITRKRKDDDEDDTDENLRNIMSK